MKKSFSLACAVFILFISFTSLFSQSSGWAPARWWNCYNAYLNLTSEQSEKFVSLQQEFSKETNPIQNELDSYSLELQMLLAKPTVDDAAIIAKQKEIFAMQQRLQETTLQYDLKAKDILTCEIKIQPINTQAHGDS